MKEWRKKYNELYGNVPEDDNDRFRYILEKLKISSSKLKEIEEEKYKISKNMKKYKKTVKLIFYIVPEGIARPRKGKGNTFYVPNINKFYQCINEYKSMHSEIEDLFIYTECHIDCRYYRPIPSDMTKTEKILAELKYIRSIKKPDWDNLGKSTDMLNTLWLDDSIVTESRVRKYYSFKPRIEIRITYYSDYINTYNKKINIKKRGN